MVRSHQGVDRVSLEDPKQTSSLCCQEPRCGPDVHSSPSHGVGHQLFCAAPPNSSQGQGRKAGDLRCPLPHSGCWQGGGGGAIPLSSLSFEGATWFHVGDSHLGLTCGLISSPLPAS